MARRKKRKRFTRNLIIFFLIVGILFIMFLLVLGILSSKQYGEFIYDIVDSITNIENSDDEIGFGNKDDHIGENRIPLILETETKVETEVAAETEIEMDASIKTMNVVNAIISSMTLEEKVAQLFVISPEMLTGVSCATSAGDLTRDMFDQYPVGGFIYFSENIQEKNQVQQMLSNTQNISIERIQLPIFTCVDEEGGTVTRISGRGNIDVPDINSMEFVGQIGTTEAYNTGKTIGIYLNDLGFNVDFAPVADVITNSENTVIGSRSFGPDAGKDAKMVSSFISGMHESAVFTTLKHFPGHGNTSQDSHNSMAVSYKTLEELEDCEFLPFMSGIEAGTDLIMIGHISLPNVTGDSVPATLSYQIVTGILRNELGFDGVIITDGMNMASIEDYYSSGEASVKAIQAGVDLILMPSDFYSAYNGVLSALADGRLSEERIDESLVRIILLKLSL